MSERKLGSLLVAGILLAGCSDRLPIPSTPPTKGNSQDTSVWMDENLLRLEGCDMDVEIIRDDKDDDIDGLTYADTNCIAIPQNDVLAISIHGDPNGDLQGVGLAQDIQDDNSTSELTPYINSDMSYEEYTVTNIIYCNVEGQDQAQKCGEITFKIDFKEPKPNLEDIQEETDKINPDEYIPNILPRISLIGCDIKTTIDRSTSPPESGLLIGSGCTLQNNTDEDIGWTINGGDPGVGFHITGGMVSANGQVPLETYISPNHENGNYHGENTVKCSNPDGTYEECGRVSYDITLQD